MEWLIVILICITYLLGFLHGGRYVLKKLSKTTYHPYSACSENTSTQESDAEHWERLQKSLDEQGVAQSKEIDRLRKKLLYQQSQER